MRIVPRPRQVGHTEDMGLPGCVDADAPHVVVLGALSTSAYRPVNDEVLDIWRNPSSRHNDLLRHLFRPGPPRTSGPLNRDTPGGLLRLLPAKGIRPPVGATDVGGPGVVSNPVPFPAGAIRRLVGA